MYSVSLHVLTQLNLYPRICKLQSLHAPVPSWSWLDVVLHGFGLEVIGGMTRMMRSLRLISRTAAQHVPKIAHTFSRWLCLHEHYHIHSLHLFQEDSVWKTVCISKLTGWWRRFLWLWLLRKCTVRSEQAPCLPEIASKLWGRNERLRLQYLQCTVSDSFLNFQVPTSHESGSKVVKHCPHKFLWMRFHWRFAANLERLATRQVTKTSSTVWGALDHDWKD